MRLANIGRNFKYHKQMIITSIPESIKRLMPSSTFITDAAAVNEMAARVVGGGLGASFLKKGDTVTGLKGMVKISSPQRGQQDPIEYLALVVDCRQEDGAVKEKLIAFSTLLRRQPNANTYHGIFAEDQFKTLENYQQVYNALAANPNFRVTEVTRGVEFPQFKATVVMTSR